MAAVTYAGIGFVGSDRPVRPARAARRPRPHHLAAVRPSTTGRRPSAAVYRRRRLIAAVALLVIVLAGSWVLGLLGRGSLTASGTGTPPPAVPAVELELAPVSARSHVVAPGDTLWSIARRLQPEGDVRPIVDALAAGRDGRPLQVGERITLP